MCVGFWKTLENYSIFFLRNGIKWKIESCRCHFKFTMIFFALYKKKRRLKKPSNGEKKKSNFFWAFMSKPMNEHKNLSSGISFSLVLARKGRYGNFQFVSLIFSQCHEIVTDNKLCENRIYEVLFLDFAYLCWCCCFSWFLCYRFLLMLFVGLKCV